MKTSRRIISISWRRLVLVLLVLITLGSLPAATTRAERETTTPTGWWWLTGVDMAAVSAKVSQGYRLTNLDIESGSPLRVSALFIQNSGVHAKSWWYYYGVDPDFIASKISADNARLIDLERYEVNGTTKYTAVLVENTGSGATGWWWYYNVSAAFISNTLNQNQARLVDLDTFVANGERLYNAVMVDNTGSSGKAWWWYYNVTPEFIGQKTNEHGARLTDIERHGDGTFTVVMEQSQGEAWWWYYGQSSILQIKHLTTLNNARLIDLEVYYPAPGQKRYAFIMLQNGPPPQHSIPVSGTYVPQLKAFDNAMVDFMLARDIPGGTLAVMKDGKVVLERGYGWKDQVETVAMPPNALLRLASITKPFTAAAIHKLASEGKLSLSDRVFCLPGGSQPCHLSIQPWPLPIVFDLRLRDITIQHLLDHKGGWDTAGSGDPVFRALSIAGDMGIASPPSQQNRIRWVLGRPLDHTPGTTYAYSNFGYMVLARIIAQVSGQNFPSYIQDALFNPLGVADSEILLGRTLLANQNPREPYYHDPAIVQSAFPPYFPVPSPYGGWDLEAMDGNGGMIATARAVATYAHSNWQGSSAVYFGSLPGTHTMLRHRADGVTIAALFNQRTDPSGLEYGQIWSILDAVADGIGQWPGDLSPISVPTAALNFLNGAPGSFFTVRAAGLEPQAELQASIESVGRTLSTGIVSTDASGALTFIVDTSGVAPGSYTIRLLTALSSGDDDTLVTAAQTGGVELLSVTFALQEGGVLRPREEGVEAPTLSIPASTSEHRIFLPLVVK